MSTQLQTDLETFLQQEIVAIRTLQKRGRQEAYEIGVHLLMVKERLKGSFMEWVANDLGMSHSAALMCMHVAGRYTAEEVANFVNVEVSALYELAAPSTPDPVVEGVRTGAIEPSVKAIREAKRDLQESTNDGFAADDLSYKQLANKLIDLVHKSELHKLRVDHKKGHLEPSEQQKLNNEVKDAVAHISDGLFAPNRRAKTVVALRALGEALRNL